MARVTIDKIITERSHETRENIETLKDAFNETAGTVTGLYTAVDALPSSVDQYVVLDVGTINSGANITDISGVVTEISGDDTAVSGMVNTISGTITDITGTANIDTVTNITGDVASVTGSVTNITSDVADGVTVTTIAPTGTSAVAVSNIQTGATVTDITGTVTDITGTVTEISGNPTINYSSGGGIIVAVEGSLPDADDVDANTLIVVVPTGTTLTT